MQNHTRRGRRILVTYAIVQALVAVAFGLLFAPLAAGGQPPGKVPRVGILRAGIQPVGDPFVEPFRQGLRDLGYV